MPLPLSGRAEHHKATLQQRQQRLHSGVSERSSVRPSEHTAERCRASADCKTTWCWLPKIQLYESDSDLHRAGAGTEIAFFQQIYELVKTRHCSCLTVKFIQQENYFHRHISRIGLFIFFRWLVLGSPNKFCVLFSSCGLPRCTLPLKHFTFNVTLEKGAQFLSKFSNN